MLSPIAQLVKLSGEAATLSSPAALPTYDPTQSADFVPPTPTVTAVRGVPVDPELLAAEGAKAGLTVLAAALPAGLDPREAKLSWRGESWRVMTVQPRYWRGAVDGYSLFLQL